MAGDFDNSVSVSLSAKVNEKPFYAARVYELYRSWSSSLETLLEKYVIYC